MKRKHIYVGILLAGIATTGITGSCNKELETTNQNRPTKATYFGTASEIEAGTNSIYSAWKGFNLVAREWFFIHDLRSDDVASGGSQLEAPRRQILLGVVDPSNPVMNSVWNALYVVIQRANTVLDAAPKATDNPAVVNRCVAEAKFLRGWAYYELASQWGSVPIYTKGAESPSDTQPKSPAAAVFAQAVKDFQEAAVVLPGKSATSLGRATKGAAYAMLGRTLMQTGDYAGAKNALLNIPTNGADGYALTDRYLDNFEEETEFNKESILEIIFVDKGNNNFNWGSGSGDEPNAELTTIRNQEYTPVAWRNLIPSDRVLNEYENTLSGAAKNDPRYGYSIYQSGDTYNKGLSTLTDGDQGGDASTLRGKTVKVGWRKFTLIYKESKEAAGFHPGGNNQRIIRYAEVLLMLAECELELGNTSAAVGYLNQVRSRASVAMPPYPTAQFPVTAKADVIKALLHEKTAELAGEEIRNIDILRWRKKGYFTTEPLSWYTPAKEFLPIPQSEIDNNPKLQ
jgi:tetratricopeptide (TPR) repeat protein